MGEGFGLVSVIDSTESPRLEIVLGGGEARAVVSPATGADHRTMNLVRLDGGARTTAMTHPQDAVYYVAAGRGRVVDGRSSEAQAVAEGAMVHVDAGDTYQFCADEGAGLTIIGGPCPADAELYVSQEA